MPDYNFEKTDHVSYLRDIGRGVVHGAELFSSYGEITTSGSVTDQIVWPLSMGSDLSVPDGVQITLSSTSANDTAAGTGVQTVVMHYLDSDLAQQTETVTLNGTTGVTTTATDVRFINCMHIASVGTGKEAAGDISAVNSGTNYSFIEAGKRRCCSSARRVPAGKRLMITGMYAGSSSGSAAASAIVRLITTAIQGNDYTEDAITIHQAGLTLQDSSQTMELSQPFPIDAGQIAGFDVTCDKAATITAGFFGWIESV